LEKVRKIAPTEVVRDSLALKKPGPPMLHDSWTWAKAGSNKSQPNSPPQILVSAAKLVYHRTVAPLKEVGKPGEILAQPVLSQEKTRAAALGQVQVPPASPALTGKPAEAPGRLTPASGAQISTAVHSGTLEPHALKGWVIRPVHWLRAGGHTASQWLVTWPKNAQPLQITLTALQKGWKVELEVSSPALASTLAQGFSNIQNLQIQSQPLQQVSVFLGQSGMGGSSGGFSQPQPGYAGGSQQYGNAGPRPAHTQRYVAVPTGVDYQA
jgi:hypothetical protein